MAAKEGLKTPLNKGLGTGEVAGIGRRKLAIKSPFEDNTGTTKLCISTRI